MKRSTFTRSLLILAAWFPFFAIWALIAVVYAHIRLSEAVVYSLISVGSASLLGIAVWHVSKRWPWPLRLSLNFYLFHFFIAAVYAFTWVVVGFALDSLAGLHKYSSRSASKIQGDDADLLADVPRRELSRSNRALDGR